MAPRRHGTPEQLALDLESTLDPIDLLDFDGHEERLAAIDAERQRTTAELLEATMAAAARPRGCTGHRPILEAHDEDDLPRCVLCGHRWVA